MEKIICKYVYVNLSSWEEKYEEKNKKPIKNVTNFFKTEGGSIILIQMR